MQQSLDGAFYRRLGVTLVVLLAYRVGCHLPLPGLDAAKIGPLSEGGGAAVARLSVLALGIMPLVNALVIAEVIKLIEPSLRRWDRLPKIVLGLALLIALVQAGGIASALEQVAGLVPEPGIQFRVTAIATMMAGAALVMAFANVIDRAGLGSGVWVLFLAPALAELPRTLASVAVLHRNGEYPFELIVVSLALVVVTVGVIVRLLLAARGARSVASTCIWTPLIGYSLLPWLLVPVGLLATRSTDGAVALLTTGPVHYIALVALIVLVSVLSVRSFASVGQPSPVPAALIALTLAAVVLAADILQARFLALLPLAITDLIIATVVATTLLGQWGGTGSAVLQAERPPVSPRA
jgi:preprotein translocase subunit SecY